MRIQWAIFGPKVSVWHHRRQNVFYAFWDRANLDCTGCESDIYQQKMFIFYKDVHDICVVFAEKYMSKVSDRA